VTPDALAGLHALCMSTPRPWNAAEFRALIDGPGGFVIGDAIGFAVGRAIANEAELLTLAVHPSARRQGHARRWLAAFEAAARTRDAGTAFLEVAADNTPALMLYRSAGYQQVGCRPGYYHAVTGGPPTDALIMRKLLPPPGADHALFLTKGTKNG